MIPPVGGGMEAIFKENQRSIAQNKRPVFIQAFYWQQGFPPQVP